MSESQKTIEEFRCEHCSTSAVEFDIKIEYVTRTDNCGQPLTLRAAKPVRTITCVQCGSRANVIVLDKEKMKTQSNDMQINNEMYIKEESNERPKAVVLNKEGGATVLRSDTSTYKKWSGF